MVFYLKYKYIFSIFLLLIVLSVLFIFQSCNKESTTTLEEDTLSINSTRGLGQLVIFFRNITFTDTVPSKCSFTIQDKKGNNAIEQNKVQLEYQDTNLFVTTPVNLNSGYYELYTCQVFDSANNILYQAKIQANPIEFKIEKDKTTKLEPSLSAIAKTDSFYIFAYYFDAVQKKYIHTTATISLSNQRTIFYTGYLTDTINAIAIPNGISYFIVNITKQLYKAYQDSIPITDLRLYKRVYPYSAFLVK